MYRYYYIFYLINDLHYDDGGKFTFYNERYRMVR